MHVRTEHLRQFMAREKLLPADVAELLGLSRNTIYIYCSDNQAGKVITPQLLELLKLKVAARKIEAGAA